MSRNGTFVAALVVLGCIAAGLGHCAHAADVYVRKDGGTVAQCDGTRDAPVSSDRHCAWIGPMIVLPPAPYGQTATPRMRGGDTLHIGDGSYMIGLGAPGSEGICTGSANFGCTMAPPPSGTAAAPTRIIGNVAHPDLVELWGNERVYGVLNLGTASFLEVGGMQITDHERCVRHHGSRPMPGGPSQYDNCTDTYPSGAWAENGIVAADSHDVILHDIFIHGLANEGIRAGRLKDWSGSNVEIIGNPLAGWDWDVGVANGGNSDNAGTFRFDKFQVAWNGCAEDYPKRNQFFGCFGQNFAGYGDGFAAGHTSGHWIFTNSHIHHNVSDGLDLLYGNNKAVIDVSTSMFDGNAGNQIKLRGIALTMIDNIVNGNCAEAWSTSPANNKLPPPAFAGKYNMDLGAVCRVGGDAVALSFVDGTRAKLVNNTITGQSECLVVLSQTGDEATDPGGSAGATFEARNNIIEANGQLSWISAASGGGARKICGSYPYNTSPAESYVNNVFYGVLDDQCPPGNKCADPKLTQNSPIGFDPRALPGSPALNAGTNCGNGASTCNIGALTIAGASNPPPPPPPPAQPTLLCTVWKYAPASIGINLKDASKQAPILCYAPYTTATN